MDLTEIRDQLDSLDFTIKDAFLERMKLISKVAEFKADKNKEVLDKTREMQKLETLTAFITDDDEKKYVEELFKQIITYSRIKQYKLMTEYGVPVDLPFNRIDAINKDNARVVYQGVEGAYSHAATIKYFGEDVNAKHVPTFADAMKTISAGLADYAVLPIENSSAGIVSDVYDLLSRYDNYIVGEVYIDVKHVLLGCENAVLSEIERVYSHPQGFMQCSRFLSEHKHWQKVATENTAVSAKRIHNMQDEKSAAIASRYAGQLYGLKELADDILDNDTNITRFIIVSNRKIYTENADKISICFELSHESGSLYTMLSHFMFNNLNMTKIESRPIPGRSWEYRFFLDFEGNLGEERVIDALRGVIEESNYFRLLGNY